MWHALVRQRLRQLVDPNPVEGEAPKELDGRQAEAAVAGPAERRLVGDPVDKLPRPYLLPIPA